MPGDFVNLKYKNRLPLVGAVARRRASFWGGGNVLFSDLGAVHMSVFVKMY